MIDASALETNRATVTRLLEHVFNDRHLDDMESVLADDFVLNPLAAFPPGKAHGSDGMRAVYEGFYEGIPDVRAETLQMVAEGDAVMVLDRFGGTHSGQLGPFAATNRPLHWTVTHLYRLRGGRITEDNVLVDVHAIMTQVGAFPADRP